LEPKTVSASSIANFESCEARYKAENIDRVPQPSGVAASLGTAVHSALEAYIKTGMHTTGGTLSDLHAFFEDAWWDEFSTRDPRLYGDGQEMLKNWYERNQDWSYRKVLMAEVKEHFELTMPGGAPPMSVTYIWDRCDQHDDGDINVVDYKSYGAPLPIDVLKERIQPRLYALAAFVKFTAEKRDFERIWVTYDLLRHDEIGIVFTRDECVDTWKYMQRVVDRIRSSNGTKETINDTCRWCVRKADCDTLQRHASGGGMLGISTLEEAIERRARADNAAKALYGERDELDAFIMREFEENCIDPVEGVTGETVIATIGGRKERKFPAERVAKLIGPDLMADYGTLTLGKLDELMKSDKLDDDTKSQIKSLIRKVPGKPTVRTKPIASFKE
jgi:hypothetical protein